MNNNELNFNIFRTAVQSVPDISAVNGRVLRHGLIKETLSQNKCDRVNWFYGYILLTVEPFVNLVANTISNRPQRGMYKLGQHGIDC